MDQGISLLSVLKSRMSWLSDRQKVVSQNVANASTPGFKPKDLAPQDFAALLKDQGAPLIPTIRLDDGTPLNMPDTSSSGYKAIIKPDSETTMDGNSVVLEEQMLKMSESRQQFEAAIGFYEKSLAMVRMAAKVPGK
ncbi:MAG: flagellar basal body protein [Asticcacaulis sp.]